MRALRIWVLSVVVGLLGCSEKVEQVAPQQLELTRPRGVEARKPTAKPKAKPQPKTLRNEPAKKTYTRETPDNKRSAPDDVEERGEPRVYRIELKEGTFQFVLRKDGKWNVLNEQGGRLGTVDVRSKGLRYLNLKDEGVATVALKDYGCKVSDKTGPLMRIWRKEGAHEIYDLKGKSLGTITADTITFGKSVVTLKESAGRIFLSEANQELGRVMPTRYPQAALFMGVRQWPVELRSALFLYWVIHELD